MRKILLIISLSIPLSSYCQLWRTLSYGIVAGPDNCYRMLTSVNKSMQWAVDFLDSVEKPGNGFHAGLNVMKPLNKHFCIESGFLFNNESYGDKIIYGQIDPGYTDNIQCDASRFIRTTKYISIPVGLRFYLNGNRISLYIAGGMAPSLITSIINKSIYYYNEKTVLERRYFTNSEINKFNIAAYGSIGTSLSILKYTRIDIAPYYQRMLLPFQFADGSHKENIYKFGLNIGLSVNL